MAKKEPTAKQLAARKAAGERMRAMHAAKKAQKEAVVAAPAEEKPEVPQEEIQEVVSQVPLPEPQPAPQAAAPAVAMTPEQFEALLSRFASMGQEPKKVESVGVIERFSVKAADYKSPVDEILDLPKFRRFGMRENYALDWTVTQARYETKQGQWYVEPRFELTFKRKQLDEEGNEVVRHDKFGKPFHPRIVLGRASFFIDPPADMVEAELAGLEDAGLSDEELRERMMFWRYQQWVEERLIPKMPEKTTNALKEEVIGGKAYQIEEYSMPL